MNLEVRPRMRVSTSPVRPEKKRIVGENPAESAEDLLKTLRSNPEQKATIKEMLEGYLGPIIAKELVDNPELFGKLLEIKQRLREPYKKGSPPFIADANFLDALAIHEAMGENFVSLVQAMDLKEYLPELQYETGAPQSKQLFSFDKRPKHEASDKRLSGLKIKITLRYREQNSIELAGIMQRTLQQGQVMNEKNEMEDHRTIHHDTFSLPEHLQGEGVAAQLLDKSLQEYDKLQIKEIQLSANIDVGAYAWATYGFGWDESYMGEAELMNQNASTQINTVLEACQLLTRNNEDALVTDSPYAESVHKILQELKQAQSPQDLALVGVDGPFFCRDRSEKWYVFPSKQEAQKKIGELRGQVGEKGETMESKTTYGVQHAGKIGILHAGEQGLEKNQWHGKVELLPGGTQQGKNRMLLENALTRRRQKIPHKPYDNTKN